MKNLIFCFFLFLIFAPSIGNCDGARFTKYDSAGNKLSADALEWAIVHDGISGLYWEVKSSIDDIHSQTKTYKYSKAKKVFIRSLNEKKFGGFSDWRLPTSDELIEIKEKRASEPFINQEYFPNTEPSLYMSWRVCGSGEIVPEKIKFGETKIKGKKRYVRAVRGKDAPE